MERTKRVSFEGEHPIFLYDVGESSVKSKVPTDMVEENQAWNDPCDPVLSSSSDVQVSQSRPNEEQESSPNSRLSVPLRYSYRKTTIGGVGQNRNLGIELVGNGQTPSNDVRDPSDESSQFFENTGSESDSSPSSIIEESGSDGDRRQRPAEYRQAGQHFENGDNLLLPPTIDDLDLDLVVQPNDRANQAVVAPFSKEGGLPTNNAIRHFIRGGEPSEVTDFGELMYSNRIVRSRKATSPVPSRTSERRRPRKSPKRSLQERLFSALQPAHEGKKDFFPKNVLSTIIDEKCVRGELAKYLEDTHDNEVIADYATRICEEEKYEDANKNKKIRCFRKVFVILVLIEKTPAIIKFLEKDVKDSDLPLKKVERPEEKGAYDLRLSRNPKKRLKCFSKKWSQLHIRNFEEFQWKTLSPFFGKGGHKDVKHYPLQDQVILPFTPDSKGDRTSLYRTLELEGGFGKVIKVHIHPDHHNFESLSAKAEKHCFAIKCLHSPDKERFKKEVEMLKKFSNPSHNHLISLLATYEQFGNFFLIFHWAEADLQRYWRDISPLPPIDLETGIWHMETVLWMAEQCKGIAHGVVEIHQYVTSSLKTHPQKEFFGHHGDIKPENVLWFPDSDHAQTSGGTLKLSDFGLAEFNIHTVLMKPKSTFATSPPYRAPEIDLEGTGAIGRSYDMWTLGCLYLEFITWMLGGWDLVTDFTWKRMEPDPMLFGQHDSPTFFRFKDGNRNKGAEIKPAVTTFIKELHAHESCTDFLHDFLDMVEKDLLVVEKHNRETRDRITSQEVHKNLGDMLRDCQHKENYACKSAPRMYAVYCHTNDKKIG